MSVQPPAEQPSFGARARAWWRRRSRKSKAAIIVAALLALLIAIPAPEEESGEDERRAAGTSAAEEPTTAAPEETTEAATTAPTPPPAPPPPVVAQVVDGDTIRLENGRRVRLVQIDAPEMNEGECFARNSRRALAALVPPGTEIRLVADPRLDQRDQFGRALRYVFVGRQNVNVALVRRGAAAPYFFNGDRGRFAQRLLAAAERAQRAGRGLWRACGATQLAPSAALATRRPPPPPPPQPLAAPPPPAGGNCDPNYRGACVPPYPPDVDCADVGSSVTIVGSDPHGLDGDDDDGAGCETYG